MPDYEVSLIRPGHFAVVTGGIYRGDTLPAQGEEIEVLPAQPHRSAPTRATVISTDDDKGTVTAEPID